MASFFENLEWRLIAKDDASANFKKVSDAQKDVADSSEKMTTANKSASGGWKDIAKGVLAGGAALEGARMAFDAVKNVLSDSIAQANEYYTSQAQLNAVLASTGGTSGMTAASINDLASALSDVTAIDDDVIVSASSMLLTFTNLKDDVFPEVTQAVLDMATAMNGGGIPSAQALRQQSLMLGKALNDPAKGLTVLTKNGVTFDDQQRTMIETMIKAGDVTGAQTVMLNELSKEFGGSAAAAANTFEGRMAKLNNTVDDVKKQIGIALIPTLSMLAGVVTDQTGKIKLSDDQMYKWQRRVYDAGQIVKIFATMIGGAIGVVVAMGNVFIKAEQLVLGALTDMVRGGINFKDNFKKIFGAIGQALTGDFTGALDTMKETFAGVFKYTIQQGIQFDDAMGNLSSSVSNGMAAVGSAIKSASDHTAFDETIASMNNAKSSVAGLAGSYSDLADASGAADESQKKNKEALDKVVADYADLKDKAGEEMVKLEIAHAESVDKIKAKLSDLSSALAETTADYQKTLGEINKTEAERVVEQEQTISDLTKKIAEIRDSADPSKGLSSSDNKQISELETQLAKEKAAYEEYITTRVGLEAELTEARRRAGETDFERFVEDITARRTEEQSSYQEKIAQIQGEVLEQQNALAEENAVYDAKKAMYAEVDAAFQVFHDNYLANLGGMKLYTDESVTQMTAKLKEMQAIFAEIQSVRAQAGISISSGVSSGGSSSTSTASPTTSEVPTAASVVINISDTTVRSEADITTLVNEITRQLQLAGLASS